MSERIVEKAELPADRASRNLVAWSLLAGILLWGALAGPFFAGRIYTADDLGEFHLPIRAFYADQLAHGQPYDWMPQLFSGFYLTGEGQGGAYHPLHQFLYRFFPLRVALGFEYLLPYPLMMLGTWLLLKRRLGRSDAAMLGGLLFAFSSFNLLHFVHPNAVAVIAHIPWLLWAIDVAMTDSRRRRVALATALIALLTGSQLLLGYPQYVWFSLIAELAYVIFLQTAHKYAPRYGCDLCVTCDDCVGCTAQIWPRVLIAKGIGLLLGGVQLLPSLDAWLHSARRGVDASFPFWGSLHPLNLLQLVAPYLLAGRVVGDNTHEFGLYVGAVPLMLIVWLLARRHELGPLAPSAWTALGFALVMLLLSFGAYGFLYPVTTWLPMLGSFRFPCRYLVLFQLAAAGLAAIGFVLLIRQSSLARQRRRQNPWCVERRSWRALWHDFEPLWCVVGFSAAVAIAGFKLRHEAYIAPASRRVGGSRTIGRGGRADGLGRAGILGRPGGPDPPGRRGPGLVRSELFRLSKRSATSARLDAVRGIGRDSARQRRRPSGRLVVSRRPAGAANRRLDDAPRLAPGRRIRRPRAAPATRLSPLARPARGRGPLGPAQPVDHRGRRAETVRQSLAGSARPVAPGAAGRRRREPAASPADDIAQICPDTTALCEVPLGLPPSKPGTAVLAADGPGRLAIEVDCPAPQLLVVAESYHDGWHATVDAQPQTLYRVNGDFMGCVVGPGKHQVVLCFQAGSLERGWLTSWIGLGHVVRLFPRFRGLAETQDMER